MKFLILITAIFIAGCEVAVIVKGPPPPPCDGLLIPGKGCVNNAKTSILSDRGLHEQSSESTEPNR